MTGNKCTFRLLKEEIEYGSFSSVESQFYAWEAAMGNTFITKHSSTTEADFDVDIHCEVVYFVISMCNWKHASVIWCVMIAMSCLSLGEGFLGSNIV